MTSQNIFHQSKRNPDIRTKNGNISSMTIVKQYLNFDNGILIKKDEAVCLDFFSIDEICFGKSL